MTNASCSQTGETTGEQHFADYLNRFNIEFERWNLPTQRQPDWLVKTAYGSVVCENKDLECGEAEDLLATEAAQGRGFGAWSLPFIKARMKVGKALEKLPAIPPELPYVVVLHNKSFIPYTNSGVIERALYGESKIIQMVGPEGALSDARIQYTEDFSFLDDDKDPIFARKAYERVSAVAVVWAEQPDSEKFADFFGQNLSRFTAATWGELEEQVVSEYERRHGPLKSEIARLALYHNPLAKVPMDSKYFEFDADCVQTGLE